MSPRAVKVLETVVRGYIVTGSPVGSRTVARQFNLDCSPATVRNEMADLTEMGYLRQTHVSSGRIPTDMGMRFYLDNIMREEDLTLNEIDRIQNFSSRYGEDFQALLRNAGRVLADMTRQAGVILMPGLRQMPLKHIEFMRLNKKRVVAILVSEGGRFFNRVFEWGEDLKQQELSWASNFLNDRFKGKTLRQIRETILREIGEERAEYDRLVGKALVLMETALGKGELDEEIFIEGRENLVEKPEFADAEKIVKIFKAFQEKEHLMNLLTKALEGSSPVVMLSTEAELGNFPELGIILARYGDTGPGGGTLGIIGPMRMNYSKMVPMVRYTARYVSDLLNS